MGEHRDAIQVSEGERCVALTCVQHYERRTKLAPTVEQLARLPRLRGAESRRVHKCNRGALSVQREGAAQSRALLLAVDLEGVGARLGAEGDPTACPDRRTVGAGAGAPGSLLTPGLCA